MTRLDKCRGCIHRRCVCLNAANDNFVGDSICIPDNKKLKDPIYIQRVARATIALKLARRLIPEWVCDQIVRFDGRVFLPSGTEYDLEQLPDFGEAFGDDADMTSIRDLLGYAVVPPRWIRKPLRDRALLLSTAILIGRPELGSQFDL